MAEATNVLNMPEPNDWGERKLYRIFWNTPAEKHPELEISVKRQDSVHWICEEKKFRVLSVDPVDENPHAPRPFYREFPDDKCEYTFQVNSGPARPAACGFTYKPLFEFEDGSKLDPHIRVA